MERTEQPTGMGRTYTQQPTGTVRTQYTEQYAEQPTGMHREQAGMQQMRRGGGLLLTGLAIGAAVGSIATLFLAPRRGREMRSAFMEAWPNRAISSDFRRKVNEALMSGRTSPTDMVNQTQRDLDDLRAQAFNKIDDAKLRAKIVQKQAELKYLKGKEKLRKEV